MSELENLFSAAVPTSDHGRKSKSGSAGPKSDKVQLVINVFGSQVVPIIIDLFFFINLKLFIFHHQI